MVILRSAKGMTLIETLIAGLLLSGIFIAVTSIYISTLKFIDSEIKAANIDTLIAMETMTRKINLAYNVVVAGDKQLKVEIDPNDPATLSSADDVWIKFGIVANSLRTKTEALPDGDVTIADPEVFPDLKVLDDSKFNLINPTASGRPNVVKIQLATEGGEPPQPHTLITSAAAGAMSK